MLPRISGYTRKPVLQIIDQGLELKELDDRKRGLCSLDATLGTIVIK